MRIGMPAISIGTCNPRGGLTLLFGRNDRDVESGKRQRAKSLRSAGSYTFRVQFADLVVMADSRDAIPWRLKYSKYLA